MIVVAGSKHRILRVNVVAALALSHELRCVAVAAFQSVGTAIVLDYRLSLNVELRSGLVVGN